MSLTPSSGLLPHVIEFPTEPLQKVTEQSETQKHALGTIYKERSRYGEERWFRYIKAGAVNLSKGLLMQSPAQVANHDNIAVGGAVEAGQIEVPITTTLATALSDGQYHLGTFHINDATAEGDTYQVKKHTNTTTPTITLYTPLITALATGSEFSLTANKHNGVIVLPTTQTGIVVGVTKAAITANWYGWVQTKGPAAVLVDTTDVLVIGQNVGVPAAAAVAGACGIVADVQHVVGIARNIAPASEYALIDLSID